MKTNYSACNLILFLLAVLAVLFFGCEEKEAPDNIVHEKYMKYDSAKHRFKIVDTTYLEDVSMVFVRHIKKVTFERDSLVLELNKCQVINYKKMYNELVQASLNHMEREHNVKLK